MARQVKFTARKVGKAVVWDGPNGKPAKEHKLHFKKGTKANLVDFTLNDDANLGLVFDQDNPFQVWEQDGCPPCGIDTDQIELVSIAADILRIRNRNSGPARRLQYQLNVLDDAGKPWPCDPIIDNDGGGT